uniref:Uncharacterized protein n=1 Tax=Anguilla anguilla TaxID=7936 RepID=A0A0E9VY89_ANGAN
MGKVGAVDLRRSLNNRTAPGRAVIRKTFFVFRARAYLASRLS